MYLKRSVHAAALAEAQESRWTQQRNWDPQCVLQTGRDRAPGCASPSRRIAAGTAGKRQEVQGGEEQWGFSLVAANKTI